MTRYGLIVVGAFAALLGCAALAQAPAVPDAPQPQKKTAPRQQPAATPPVAQTPPILPAPDDNAFPEAASREAAKAAQTPADKPSTEDKPSTTPGKPSTAADNPFPESVSRDAAKAAEQENVPELPKPAVPAGVSSSQSQEAPDLAPVNDPERARKDTEVGSYYLKSQDYAGALLRFQDAANSDPTNVDAIFGLAEAQRSLGKNADAAREYQLYLDIVPRGPKAKEAMKALKSLSAARATIKDSAH